ERALARLVAFGGEGRLEVGDQGRAEGRVGLGASDDLVKLRAGERQLPRGFDPGLGSRGEGPKKLGQALFIKGRRPGHVLMTGEVTDFFPRVPTEAWRGIERSGWRWFRTGGRGHRRCRGSSRPARRNDRGSPDSSLEKPPALRAP